MVLSNGTRVIVRLVYMYNAHVTELRCEIIGNFEVSNRHQSEETEMASIVCHRLIISISKTRVKCS